jgi:hypothetical protein
MATPAIIGARPRSTRVRAKGNTGNNPQPTTPIKVTAATKLGSVLTVTFDQPVSLNGVPKYATSVVGATAMSAALTGMNTVAITYSATITTASTLTIPYEEPAIRNASGGFVSTSTFPVT